jgi:hypothetical protein
VVLPGQTHLNPTTETALHDGVDLFTRKIRRLGAEPKLNAFTQVVALIRLDPFGKKCYLFLSPYKMFLKK